MEIKSPKNNAMPIMDDIHSKNTLSLILNGFFGGAGPKDKVARGLWINYVRIVDQAIYEYHLAREKMEEHINTDNNVFSPLLRCSTHLENCIACIRKAIRFARAIRKNQAAPYIPRMDLLSDSGSRKIMRTRNILEHLEEKLINGELNDEGTIMVAPQEKHLIVGTTAISYDELSSWLNDLFHLAEAIKDYRPTQNA